MPDSSQKPGGPKSVQTLMRGRGTGFARLLAHARVLNRLDEILASVLEPGLAEQCQVADFRDGCMVVICSNAAFATRLRMISPQLLESFREEGEAGVERVKIRVAPVSRPQPDEHQKQSLSPAALEALGRFAADSGDAEIQAIFERIKARSKY